jgi:hypothetical protein
LNTQTSPYYSRVHFSATNKDSADQFVILFHQQNQHPGLLVDICTLDGLFLHMGNENCIVANSSKAPTYKFLIIPVDD